jgi:hypothetical protein
MKSRVLLLSPHPDDICFSLGGSIISNKTFEIMVCTIFTKKKYNIRKMDISDVQQKVIEEEKDVISSLGVKYTSFSCEDAAMRTNQKLSKLMGPNINWPQEKKLQKSSLEKTKNHISLLIDNYSPEYLGIPMACGWHIDHLIVRESISYNEYLKNIHMFFYEDMPYSCNSLWLNNAIQEIQQSFIIEPYLLNIEKVIDHKIKLCSLYYSQVKDRDIKNIINYACDNYKVPSERIWNIKTII